MGSALMVMHDYIDTVKFAELYSSGGTMIGRPRLKVNTAEFTKMYNNGVPIIDIVKHFGISKSTVRSVRIELNIPKRRWRVKFDQNEYMKLYRDDHVTYQQMSEHLGISKWLVKETRKRLGLSARKRGLKRVR